MIKILEFRLKDNDLQAKYTHPQRNWHVESAKRVSIEDEGGRLTEQAKKHQGLKTFSL
ncbi:MAG: hypothetical protein JW764_06200 [Chlorobiaceae bacterium]|nr:hypothetical protein [Chlorobiaceae bacterium]